MKGTSGLTTCSGSIDVSDLTQDKSARPITVDKNGELSVPAHPVIPFIRGDGTGVDIWPVTRMVLDAAVHKAYRGTRSICWLPLYAGEEAMERFGIPLPPDTVRKLRSLRVAIKGPLTTPIGRGFRSINVTLRQALDLYACVRPIYYFQGVPSPIRYPERINMIIFRENTEDVYMGIEWKPGSPEARRLISFINEELLVGTGKRIRTDAGIGVKPITKRSSQRLVRLGIEYALREGLPSVTLVHKGNIMKYTEGAFRQWGYEVAYKEYADKVVLEQEGNAHTEAAHGKVIIKDRMADAMFQQILLRPEDYHVICTPNLNGDYLSDACAALIGGLGMAPGGNIGDNRALFEATHGSAPKYAGQDKVNPSSLILSGAAMLDYLGWREASGMIRRAIARTILDRCVTYDLERQLRAAGVKGVKSLRCSQFGEAVCNNLD